jgi:cysteine desulfurase
MTYLDWAATSPPDSHILTEAAAIAAESFGNPSSKHKLGLDAKSALGLARGRLEAALCARSPGKKGRIVFTGGGSEADAIALLAVLRQAMNARRDGSIKRLHIVTTEIEHAAVYEQAQLLKALGLDVSFVQPESDGRVDPQKIAAAVEKDTALVAVMAVNNETGAIQSIADIAKAVADAAAAFGRKSPRFHVDAVQALGKVAFDPQAAGVSSAAFSAHKIRGPRCVGALWVADAFPIEPLALGGGQEAGLRPGTESIQGAWAFAEAAEAAATSFEARIAHARELEARLIGGIAAIPGALALPAGRVAGD